MPDVPTSARDDPTDKISQGDSFTDQQLRIIAKDLGVPDDLNVEIRQSPKAYWESAGLWDIYVEITHNGKLVASGSFDVETGEMGRLYSRLILFFFKASASSASWYQLAIFESDF